MFRRYVLGIAILAGIAFPAHSAVAQDSASPDPERGTLEEIVVLGVRGSLARGLEIKRNNMQIVDSIVAEDIGKFPDNNVVEALQRVTGVQVTGRGGGEVSTVTIRGLPDLTTTINGRNIFTTSGRQVALADIPASLLHRVDVYKTRSASLIEHGIAGVLDIHTHRPFNFDGSRITIAGRAVHQEQADKTDPIISLLASNRWETGIGEVGALINVSQTNTHFRDQSVTVGAFFPFFTDTPPAGQGPFTRIPTTDSTGATVWVPGTEPGLPIEAGSTLPWEGGTTEYLLQRDAVFASDLTGDRERPAWNIALQLAPNDDTEYTFEAFYNGFRQDTFNSLFFTFIDNPDQIGTPDPNVAPPLPAGHFQLFPGTNIVKGRQIAFPFIFTSGDLTKSETDTYMYALSGNWQITDDFNLNSEVYYQESEFETEFFAMRAIRVPFRMEIDANPGNGIPAYQFFDDPFIEGDQSVMSNPDDWTADALFDNGDRDEGDALTFTLDGDLATDWGIINSVQFGVRWDDRGAEEHERRQSAAPILIPFNDFQDRIGGSGLAHVNSDFFDGRTDMPASWLVPDGDFIYANRDAIREEYNAIDPANFVTSDQLMLNKLFEVDELTVAAYAQANFATEVGGKSLDGQLGLRYVTVDTDMAFGGETASASASELLPSFMVRLGITDSLLARVSYGETLRRPAFSDLNPNINLLPDVTDVGRGTADGGNPDLKPTESKNLDLSLEWYFGDSSALYATWFERDIEGFVVPTNSFFQFENPDNPDDPLNGDYILTVPNNTSNGKLDGYELGVVWFPEDLPGYADGLGIQASYTALDSHQDLPIFDELGNIVGTQGSDLFLVSDSSYSVVLAYDREDFDARLSYVWREAFKLDNDAPIFANPLARFSSDEESLDLQLSYYWSDDFVVTLDATNLTDEVFQTNYGGRSQLMNFGSAIFSRTYALGFRASF